MLEAFQEFASTAQPILAQRWDFSVDAFAAAHPVVRGLLSDALGLRGLFVVVDDDEEIFPPRFVSPHDGEDSDDDDEEKEPGGAGAPPPAAARLPKKRLRVSLATPPHAQRTLIEVTRAMFDAAIRRDNSEADAHSDERLAQRQRVALAMLCSGMRAAGAADAACDGRALVLEALTRPFAPEPSDTDVNSILDTLVAPLQPLLAQPFLLTTFVRPLLAKLQSLESGGGFVRLTGESQLLERAELFRWRAVEAAVRHGLPAVCALAPNAAADCGGAAFLRSCAQRTIKLLGKYDPAGGAAARVVPDAPRLLAAIADLAAFRSTAEALEALLVLDLVVAELEAARRGGAV